MRGEPLRDREEVLAALPGEQGQGTQHDPRGRVVEDEGGNEAGAALLGEQVHGRHHLVVVAAVERGEQRLERGEVDRRQVDRGPQGPLAQRGAEHVEVERLEVRDPRDPHERQRGGGPREDHVPAAEDALGEDEERGERLPAPLAHELDEGLRPAADGVRERDEEQLVARPVERVAQAAVRPLQRQRGHEAPAEGDPGRADEHEDGQDPQRAHEADGPEEPAAHDELGEEREEVEQGVEPAEELPEPLRRHRAGHRALEDEVGERERHGGHEREHGEAPHVGVGPQDLDSLGKRAAPPGAHRRPAARAPEREGGARRGEAEQRRGDEHQRGGGRDPGHEPGGERPRRGAEQAPRPHDRVEALGLGDGVQVAEDHPELEHGQAAEQARPHVQRVEERDARPRGRRPEPQRHERTRAEQPAERKGPRRPPASPGHLGEDDRDERDQQVDDREP